MKYFFLGCWLLFTLCACQSAVHIRQEPIQKETTRLVLGNEILLLDSLHLVTGKRVGLVTNPSGVNSQLQSTADVFAKHPQIELTALFGPEHGIRGAIYAGNKVADEVDPVTGVPVYSLYGKTRKPTPQMLNQVDVLVVDIQDIGVRAYTYIYTMARVMEAAAENNLPVLVLDRPNPLGGVKIEGNVVESGFESFVGLYPIAYRHGMTIGELAVMFNDAFGIHCDLTVVPMKGWHREMLWAQTGLNWIPPSPHVPHAETVLFMSTTGTIGELHAVSEGVGYTSPFELIGAPWINGRQLADSLNALQLPGVLFRPLYYKPYYALFAGQAVEGVQIHLTNARKFDSYETGLHILATLIKLYPQQDLFGQKQRLKMFHHVMGCDWITKALQKHTPVPQIIAKWQPELDRFKKRRRQYLIYQ